jgi:BON domain
VRPAEPTSGAAAVTVGPRIHSVRYYDASGLAGLLASRLFTNSYAATGLRLTVPLHTVAHPRVVKISTTLVAAAIASLIDSNLYAAEPPAGSPHLQPQDTSVSTSPSNESSDLAVTAQIRSALSADATLSADAKRIQIVTNAEVVILRGTVQTSEPDRIETEVRRYAGIRQVLNQLTVVASN